MGQRAPLFDAGIAQLARATKTNVAVVLKRDSSANPVKRCRLAVEQRPPSDGQAALIIRRLRRRVEARPYPCLFSNFI